MLSFMRRIFEPTFFVSSETPGGGPTIATDTSDVDETERNDRNVSNFFTCFYDDVASNNKLIFFYIWFFCDLYFVSTVHKF